MNGGWLDEEMRPYNCTFVPNSIHGSIRLVRFQRNKVITPERYKRLGERVGTCVVRVMEGVQTKYPAVGSVLPLP